MADTIEVTLRTFIPAEAVAVNYPSNYVTNGNDRSFSTADDASIKTSQSALLSFGTGGELLLAESGAEPNRSGRTFLYSIDDASPTEQQSGGYTWRYELENGAQAVRRDKLDPTSFDRPEVSLLNDEALDQFVYLVDFHLDAKDPLPPPVKVPFDISVFFPGVFIPGIGGVPPLGNDLPPPADAIPAISADLELKVWRDAAQNTYFSFKGAHDGFPAYELLIDHKLVYRYNPLEADDSPLALLEPEDQRVPDTIGLIRAKTELLANPSFEQPPTAERLGGGEDWSAYRSIPGWTTEPGSANLEVKETGHRGVYGGDGHWLDSLASPGGIDISQLVGLGLGQTGHLTITAAAGPQTQADERLQFLLNDEVVKEITVADFEGNLNEFRQFAVDVVGQNGPDELRIRSLGADDNYRGFSIDQVSLATGNDLIFDIPLDLNGLGGTVITAPF